MKVILTLSVLFFAQVISSTPVENDIDPKFSYGLNPESLRLEEIAKTVKDLNTAVMGIAELTIEIDKNVRSVRSSVGNKVDGVRRFRSLEEDVESREKLARKTEKLLSIHNSPKVDSAKEAIAKQVEYNFLKTLSALALKGPIQAHEQQEAVFKVMQSTLNGELDFKTVVEKLPVIAREEQGNRLSVVLRNVRENQRKGTNVRQLGGLQSVDKILDVASKLNLKEVGGFLKEIPEIFEGVESIVDGVDEHF